MKKEITEIKKGMPVNRIFEFDDQNNRSLIIKLVDEYVTGGRISVNAFKNALNDIRNLYLKKDWQCVKNR